MTEHVPLPPDVEARLRELREVDLLVGIPSYNNAESIGHVARAVAAGVTKYFPDCRSVLVNSDGGSKDGTPDVVRATRFDSPQTILASHPVTAFHKIVTPYHGIPGKGSAFRTIFAIAERLNARACAVVDADLRSITPEWMELLMGPVLKAGLDYVAPLYLRHKYDGTITNSIVYPLTRALYGKDVRQPIGGEFGFSGRLASHFLERPVWLTNVARFGIDIWMTTTAIADGFKICQAFLGAKIHDAKDPAADLTEMMTQVVSSVFDLMSTYEPVWRTVASTEEVPLFGFPHSVGLEPIPLNVERMITIFRRGLADLLEVWERALAPETLRDVRALRVDGRSVRLEDGLWVRIVYDFAAAYHHRALPPEQLLSSLIPLYLGRTASFVCEMENASAGEVEKAIAGLAEEYMRQKNYLLSRWS